MGIKKFINTVLKSLGIEDFEKTGKKKSVKRLLSKLKNKKESLEKVSKSKLSKKEKKELKEELDIINLHIKKGEKILNELNEKEPRKDAIKVKRKKEKNGKK